MHPKTASTVRDECSTEAHQSRCGFCGAVDVELEVRGGELPRIGDLPRLSGGLTEALGKLGDEELCSKRGELLSQFKCRSTGR